MNKLDKFIEVIELQVTNHSIYVWGGNGEDSNIISESWIRRMENSVENAKRAISFWKIQVSKGYEDLLRAFDCSGLGIYALREVDIIADNADMNANTLKGKCTKISKSDLHRGDWVFRCDATGHAYHIGYVVNNDLDVIEAKGRDDGVIKRTLNAGGTTYWNYFGRPSYFKAEIEATIPVPPVEKPKYTFTRKLTIGSRGTDVRWLQERIGASVDGVFGSKTSRKLIAFQEAHKIAVDGVMGPQTVKAMGDIWKPHED